MEDFIERLHQDGNTAMVQLAATQDYKKKVASIGFIEAIQTRKDVVEKKKLINGQSKQKFSDSVVAIKEEKMASRQKVKAKIRDKALEMVKNTSYRKKKSGFNQQVEM